MESEKMIGMLVRNTSSNAIGTIEYIKDGIVAVDFHGTICRFPYPAAFNTILELEDEDVFEEIKEDSVTASFDTFKKDFSYAVGNEIAYIKSTGGKKYRVVDGERLASKEGEYLYAFDTDSDLNFPDGTAIKLWFPDIIVPAFVVSCEDFTIVIRTMEYIGETIETVEFTAEQWALLEALIQRLDELNPTSSSIAFQIACNGRSKIVRWQHVYTGQNTAINKATSEPITFIWGPPGTGKTETLANIALMHIKAGKRVLMVSYSNVSVDGALLRVANKADLPEGMIVRYGYPRMKELLESKTLTSYQYVLYKNPVLAKEYQELTDEKRKLKKKDPRRVEINRKLNRIRELLLDLEKDLIQRAAFVATTISKTTIDKALYGQHFDVVIFDEASMAYVPQIVFAASLAKQHFVCLGDFRQLPAIVQNAAEHRLTRDIFEYVGIEEAVEEGYGHEWLVMLDTQYRCHYDIASFVSEQMYSGLLKTSDRVYESRKEIALCSPCEGAAMSIVDLSDMYSVCTKTMDGSRINILSAFVCLRLAEQCLSEYEVGIITPYSAQSRLILSMIRDLQEMDSKWSRVSCATVHQFQGSEKTIIIYDAVDCYRMPYPGMLLTSLKNNTANRLFNVALTRAKGKFILVGNIDYLKRKKISQKLMFTNAVSRISRSNNKLKGENVLNELGPNGSELPAVYIENRETSWERFIDDIRKAKSKIQIDVPDVIDDGDTTIDTLVRALKAKAEEGVEIRIRIPEEIDLPGGLQEYVNNDDYVAHPVTVIDKKVIWFGQPLYAAEFIAEGEILDTDYFPCVRFVGAYAARFLQAVLEL